MSGIIAENSGRHTGLVKASSGGAGVWNLILTQTASASATISFTSGIDSTYDKYVFKFYNIHPATDGATLNFQANAAGGSGYNETMTTTYFLTYHDEGDSTPALGYEASLDQAQATRFQRLAKSGNGNDECSSGELCLFNPSSTVFVTHYFSRTQNLYTANSEDDYSAGYFNTTSAIDEIQFKMSSGNIDAGQISLFGIS